MSAAALPVAAVCLAAGDDVAANLDRAEATVRRAAAGGARLVALPENFAWRGPEARLPEIAEPLSGGIVGRFAALARALGVHVLLGSLLERAGTRVFNTSVLLSASGGISGAYRKIHLFDADLPGKRIRESETIAPGDRLAVAEIEGWRVGLQICYDIRFAEAAAALRAAGAEILCYPANFTAETGRAHWRALLVARATETGCAVVAPAQYGVHAGLDIETHGHACVLDPWGDILAESTGEGIAAATIRRDRLEEIRRRLPVFEHRRPAAYGPPPPGPGSAPSDSE